MFRKLSTIDASPDCKGIPCFIGMDNTGIIAPLFFGLKPMI
jgi:hypothetical protein